MKLDIVLHLSTRDGREGFPIAEWVLERARGHGAFEPELVDLRKVNLPLFDEPKHPRFRQYEHAHTKAWSAIVAAADAFVFVTPEYNYGMPPALLNAIDYLSAEWAYKAAAIVSYGGISGGTRSAQMTKQMLPSVKVDAAFARRGLHPVLSKHDRCRGALRRRRGEQGEGHNPDVGRAGALGWRAGAVAEMTPGSPSARACYIGRP